MSDKRVIMFGGKGGVGKTTCAGATALHYADSGLKTLVISTDPAPSLSDIFEIEAGQKQVKVKENLYLAELGDDEVKDMWDRKFGHEVYEIFSTVVSIEYHAFVDFITSILPGLREEFMVNHINSLVQGSDYRMIVWDTAPLGQTIDLLKMPGMMRDHLKPAVKIYSKLKIGDWSKRSVLDIIKRWARISNEDMEFLQREVDFNLVAIPEALSVQQIDPIMAELSQNHFGVNRLIINNVVQTAECDFLRAKRDQQQSYLAEIYRKPYPWQTVELPLFPHEIKGVERLQDVRRYLFGQTGN